MIARRRTALFTCQIQRCGRNLVSTCYDGGEGASALVATHELCSGQVKLGRSLYLHVWSRVVNHAHLGESTSVGDLSLGGGFHTIQVGRVIGPCGQYVTSNVGGDVQCRNEEGLTCLDAKRDTIFNRRRLRTTILVFNTSSRALESTRTRLTKYRIYSSSSKLTSRTFEYGYLASTKRCLTRSTLASVRLGLRRLVEALGCLYHSSFDSTRVSLNGVIGNGFQHSKLCYKQQQYNGSLTYLCRHFSLYKVSTGNWMFMLTSNNILGFNLSVVPTMTYLSRRNYSLINMVKGSQLRMGYRCTRSVRSTYGSAPYYLKVFLSRLPKYLRIRMLINVLNGLTSEYRCLTRLSIFMILNSYLYLLTNFTPGCITFVVRLANFTIRVLIRRLYTT